MTQRWRARTVAPPMPLGDPAAVDVAKLRVAYYTDDGTLAVSPAVRRAVIEAAGMLAGRGAQVAGVAPAPCPQAVRSLLSASSARMAARSGSARSDAASADPRIAQLIAAGQRARVRSSPRSWAAARGGAAPSRGDARNFGHRDTVHYWRLVEAQMDYQRDFLRALDHDDGGPFDVIICPACVAARAPHGASNDLLTAGGYAILYNVLGYPTGVVPVTRVRSDEETPAQTLAATGWKASRRRPSRAARACRSACRWWRVPGASTSPWPRCAPSKLPCALTPTILE